MPPPKSHYHLKNLFKIKKAAKSGGFLIKCEYIYSAFVSFAPYAHFDTKNERTKKPIPI